MDCRQDENVSIRLVKCICWTTARKIQITYINDVHYAHSWRRKSLLKQIAFCSNRASHMFHSINRMRSVRLMIVLCHPQHPKSVLVMQLSFFPDALFSFSSGKCLFCSRVHISPAHVTYIYIKCAPVICHTAVALQMYPKTVCKQKYFHFVRCLGIFPHCRMVSNIGAD